ncbi:putative NAD(P)-binding domain-containing protein [Medicago truncatula]|uniref:Putative NAD(P)-binding domain-containing protein n=1 Tax=Medicago truncatula TaxID=3880 RepID=A0A396HLW4_MEDTR|nr:putative NAD(P)-binding domain-containing protein [Medicago truncatula]
MGPSRRTPGLCLGLALLGRLGETKDVAPLVGFLASNAGEWVNAMADAATFAVVDLSKTFTITVMAIFF